MANGQWTMENKNMKKIIILTGLFFAFFLPPQASAHVLETDGNIGAVIHIDPDDDPIAGEQTGFFFEFKDKQNKFNSQHCECRFTILEGGRELYAQPLFRDNTSPSLTSASVYYTFPLKNIYKIQLTGKPTIPDTFQPFTLTYDIRVERESDKKIETTEESWFSIHTHHIRTTIIIAFFVIILGIYLIKHRKKGGEHIHE